MSHAKLAISTAVIGLLSAVPAAAQSFSFSTGDPDGKIATATRPDIGGPFEIESADDFVLTHATSITSATFTGLLPIDAPLTDIGEVVVEIYRVFPKDSQDPPSGNVPTRVNSPSDVAFEYRDSTSSSLTFTPTLVQADFAAANSVQPGGIRYPTTAHRRRRRGPGRGSAVLGKLHQPLPPPSGPLFLRAPGAALRRDFLVAVGAEADRGGTARPLVPDLQSWTRDDPGIAPDWLRVGTDIVGPDVGAPTFNAAFSLEGSVVPEPSTWAMMLLGFAGLGFAGYRHARKTGPATAHELSEGGHAPAYPSSSASAARASRRAASGSKRLASSPCARFQSASPASRLSAPFSVSHTARRRVSLSLAAISISPVTAFGRPFFPCADLRNEHSTRSLTP